MMFLKTTLLGFIVTIISCNNTVSKNTANQAEPVTQKISVKDSLELVYPTLYVYGMVQPQDHERHIVAGWYGFKFSIEGGCISPKEKGTDEHNERTDSILTARIGKDWRKRFENSADSLYSIDSLAIAIAYSDSYVQKFDTTTGAEKKQIGTYEFYPNLRYICHSTTDDNIKVVSVDGYGKAYKSWGDFHYLSITVNLKKKKVIDINKTEYTWE